MAVFIAHEDRLHVPEQHICRSQRMKLPHLLGYAMSTSLIFLAPYFSSFGKEGYCVCLGASIRRPWESASCVFGRSFKELQQGSRKDGKPVRGARSSHLAHCASGASSQVASQCGPLLCLGVCLQGMSLLGCLNTISLQALVDFILNQSSEDDWCVHPQGILVCHCGRAKGAERPENIGKNMKVRQEKRQIGKRAHVSRWCHIAAKWGVSGSETSKGTSILPMVSKGWVQLHWVCKAGGF